MGADTELLTIDSEIARCALQLKILEEQLARLREKRKARVEQMSTTTSGQSGGIAKPISAE